MGLFTTIIDLFGARASLATYVPRNKERDGNLGIFYLHPNIWVALTIRVKFGLPSPEGAYHDFIHPSYKRPG